MAKSDGTVYVDTHIDTKGFGKGINTMQKQIGGLSSAFGKLGAVITSTFAAGILVNWGKEAIQAGADTQAMAAQFKQVFGKVEQEATSSLNSIAESTGIVTERLKGSYTQIAAFAKTAGMTEKEAMELADRAMIAVADSAAFYDRSLEDTTESLRSFLKGNFENDAALGLSATEYTRNAAAVELFGKNFKELNEQQKQLTLLKMVEDANKLSGAMGQATRESDTWNNVTGNLSQALKNLSASVGQYILPIATKIVRYISSVIESINALLNKVFQLNNAITGQETYSNAAEGANEYASEISGIADAAKEATKAQNNYLAGLDEIRTYQTPQEVSEMGNVSYSDFSVENKKENNNLENSISLIERLRDKLSELQQQYPILNNIFSIIQTQMSLSKEIGTDLFNLLTRPFTDNKEGFLVAAGNISEFIKTNLEKAIVGFDEAFEHFNQVYTESIQPVIQDFTSDLSELATKSWNGLTMI